MTNQKLRSKVVSGLRWTASTRAVGQLITWSSTLILVRLLTPADYGLVTMATVVSSYLLILGEMGLSAALIQRPNLDLVTKRNVFGFLLICGLSLFAVSVLLAPLISQYFLEPRVESLVLIVAIQFLLIPFAVIPQANLATEMRFGALGNAGLASAVIGALATLALAYLGFGPYALASGIVVVLLSRVIILNVIAPFSTAPCSVRRRWQVS